MIFKSVPSVNPLASFSRLASGGIGDCPRSADGQINRRAHDRMIGAIDLAFTLSSWLKVLSEN
jgi:hypothetical protein